MQTITYFDTQFEETNNQLDECRIDEIRVNEHISEFKSNIEV